jgi:hypothetical protein
MERARTAGAGLIGLSAAPRTVTALRVNPALSRMATPGIIFLYIEFEKRDFDSVVSDRLDVVEQGNRLSLSVSDQRSRLMHIAWERPSRYFYPLVEELFSQF